MPTPQKEQKVAEIKAKFEKATGIVLTDFKGITVKDLSILRRKLRAEKAEYRVFKNRLAAIAISGFPFASIKEQMTETTAIAISYGDPMASLKALYEFTKIKKMPIKTGVIDGQVYTSEQLNVMKDIPSMNVLRSMLLSCLQAPARGLVTVLSAGSRGFVQVLAQRAKKLEEGAAPVTEA